MKNLQSQDLPFRTLDQFYKPTTKPKIAEGIKVFPKSYEANKQGIFATNPMLPSIIGYISELNETKHLPRRVSNRHQYFSVPKPCRRHDARPSNVTINQMSQGQQIKKSTLGGLRVDTLSSNHITNRSMAEILSQRTAQQKILNEEKSDFNSFRKFKKQEKQKEMRFSFYNTIQKSEYFLKRFKEDTFLNERKTNKYQNMFKRNITASNILMMLDQSKEKIKYGF